MSTSLLAQNLFKQGLKAGDDLRLGEIRFIARPPACDQCLP